MKKVTSWFLIILLLIGTAAIIFNFYSYIFSKKISGVVIGIERVTSPTAILGRNVPAEQLYSFAIAVKDEKGEIYTGSTEDRQWAVTQKGQCVEAKFFPYPPWDLDKGNTYHNVRLQRIFECPPGWVP